MKYLVLTFILLIFFGSCQQSSKTDLTNFPKDWVRLTEKENKLVIYNSCDAGNLLLTITEKNDKYGILFHGQQEDDIFDVMDVMKRNDTLILNTKGSDSKELQDFKFIWKDKDKGIGQWITTYSSGFTSDLLFVRADKQSSFKKVDQPCRECWGDECDEIEAKKLK